MIQILLAVYSGFSHAFEADHLLAVSNIVTNRDKTKSAIKDGIYWGLGHSSTIILIGLIVMLLKVEIGENTFHYFEAGVGLLLICLALFRLHKFWKMKEFGNAHNYNSIHSHNHPHHLAYFVGLIHGLAGSGALIVLVMAKIQSAYQGILYLSIFGIGSILGMLVAAGLLSVPFTKRIANSNYLQTTVILTSCALCIFFGGMIMCENLIG